MTSALAGVLPGLALGLSLIVAIGAQNLFVLRQGLRREHVGAVVLVCAVSDVVLISAGVLGTGAVVEAVPWLVPAVRAAGAVFLAGCAVLAARRVFRPVVVALSGGGTTASLGAVVATGMALTWLNPHVYLDTVVMLGSVAVAHGDDRWPFALGAVLASFLWFATLGFGARVLRPLFSRPSSWRVLDAVTVVVLGSLAVSLAIP